jgi:hypothetical protein
MKRSVAVPLAIAVLLLVLVAIFAMRDRGRSPPQPPSETADVLLPVEYEFTWRRGDNRGVDVPQTVNVHGRDVPIRHLADIVGNMDEDELVILLRVREYLLDHAHRTKKEACGHICNSSSGSTGVRVTTNDAHIACAVAPICPPGFVPKGETIHVHCPPKKKLNATLADEILTRGQVRRGDSTPFCSMDVFSFTDLAGKSPGYLAATRGLRYHDGQRNQRWVFLRKASHAP